MNKEDRELGMGRSISRRDFVQGVAVATAGAGALGKAGSAFAQAAAAATGPSPATYPPLRLGLRGMHPGAFEEAHNLRDGKVFSTAESTGEVYDLVVVGGGLSGLAAAVWYRKEAGPTAKILVLDNHDDFGGHAKRNEFWYKGQQYLANGGSSYLVAPPEWQVEAKTFLDDLGVDWKNPRYPRTNRMQSDRRLGAATYFNKKHYGKDTTVLGSYRNPTADFLKKTPLNSPMQGEVLRLFTGTTDYMAGLSKEEKIAKLRSMTYRDYLINVAKFSPEIIGYSGGIWCLGADMCTAWFAFFRYAPGFNGLGLERPHMSPEGPEHRATDYNWVCGNSDLARLMVRSLIPDSLAAGPWLAVEGQRVDYSTLDRPSNATRIRVSSIVVSAKHIGAPGPQFEPEGREVLVSYTNGGRLLSVVGKHVIMAGMNNVIPYLCPDMPEPQKAALHSAVRAVNQQTNVLFRNWEAFAKLGASRIEAPHNFFGTMSMGGGTLVGDQAPIKDPSQPIVVGFGTGVNTGVLSNITMATELCDGAVPEGGSIDDHFRMVRAGMLTKDFAFWERQIRQMAAAALSGTNFDPARDIVGITVNRWPHGFATGRSTLEDDPTQISPTVIAKQKFGNIAIANSDAAGTSLAQSAIYEAYRAVQDLKPRSFGFYEFI